MDVNGAALHIDRDLRAEARPERATHERAYLESELEHYGVSVPTIRRVARAFLRSAGPLDRSELTDLVGALWQRPVHEHRMAAVELLTARVGVLDGRDLPLLERLLRESRTWALLDPLAIHVVGPLIETDVEAAGVLERWARDDEMWLRRAALLAHLLPMRRGDEAVFERFTRFADMMLEERDFFIRKAIGWILRERGRKRPDEVGAWLLARRHRASGLTLREAARHLGDAWQVRLLPAKRRPSGT